MTEFLLLTEHNSFPEIFFGIFDEYCYILWLLCKKPKGLVILFAA